MVNFLIIGFMVALVWALTWPEPGRALAHQRFGGVRIVSFLNNCMVSSLSLSSMDQDQSYSTKETRMAVLPRPALAFRLNEAGLLLLLLLLAAVLQVFLVSGLTLRMSHFRRLGTHWQSVLYGLVVILLGTPLLAPLALRLPLEPLEFRQVRVYEQYTSIDPVYK